MTIERFLDGIPGLEWWMIYTFMVILFSLILNYIQKKVLFRAYSHLKKTKTYWDDALFSAAQKPLSLLIWILGLTLAADIIYYHTQTAIFEISEVVRYIGVIYCLLWFLFGFIKNVERSLINRHEQGDETAVADRTTIEAIGKLIRLSLAITAVLVTLQTLGFSVSGVLAFGGVGGIAVGFAARDLLANFFGAFMIYMDRPFAVGDWIRSPDRSIEGTVEAIGWRLTRIRTFEKRPLYVPNSIFTNIIVENPSRMSHRRIYETVGIRYDDIKLLPEIVSDIKKMLIEHEEIDHEQTLIVNFDNFSDSSIDFFIYAFTKTTNWIRYHEVKEDVLLKVAGIIGSYQAQIAYPTTTIHFPDELKFNRSPIQNGGERTVNKNPAKQEG